MMQIWIFTSKQQCVQLSIDDADLTQATWTANPNGYPVGRYKKKLIFLHRAVMERKLGEKVPAGMYIDHIDGNPLNCQRNNLRLATPRQNTFNTRRHRDGKTGYKGVHSNGSAWYAAITHNGKREFHGPYKTPLEAARIYDQKAIEYRGEYARINGV